ncbi:hypothetical protein [Streptomyces tritici]|uniref:F0F1 ATP synthase subunit B family protein n=1 Tax=Streptomyces tritici TaxID=2054410 RepID=UPI003AF18189
MTLAQNSTIFDIDLGPLNPVTVELILGVVLFGLTFLILAKAVLPKISKTIAEREKAIDGGNEHAEDLRAEAADVRAQYEAELAEARHEAARIRSRAQEEGAAAIAAAREEGARERDAILAAGHERIAEERAAAERELNAEVDTWARTLAGRVVGEPVAAERS